MPETPNYAEVPDDYPLYQVRGAVSGYQPKLLLRRSSDGKLHTPGNAPDERWHDWQYSLSLAAAMVGKCLESKAGKRAHMTEEEIILQYYRRALASGGRYGTEDQLRWTFTKVAKTLAWPLPTEIAKPSNVDGALYEPAQ